MTDQPFPAPRPSSVFDRTMLQTTRSRRAWSVGIGLVTVGLTAMFPSIGGNTALTDALTGYPEAMQKLFDLTDFTSGPGYLRAEILSFTAPLLLLIPAVLWGSGVVGDDEASGSIDLSASAPVSRRRLLVGAWTGVAADITTLGAVFTVTLVIGSSTFDLDVAVDRLLAAGVAITLLALVFAALSLATTAATGHTALGRGIAAAAGIAAYLVSSLSELIDGLRPFRPLSPWYHTLGVDPVGTGFRPLHLAVPLALTVVLVVVAAWAYDRRDLGT